MALLVAALLAALVAPGTATASVTATTTAAFSDAVPEQSLGASRVGYSVRPIARVAWGDPVDRAAGQTRLDFLPAPVDAPRGLDEPFPVGDVYFVNTGIYAGSSIRSVRLDLSVAVVDQQRGASFTATVALPLQVDVTDDDKTGCPYNPSPPCADAVLLPPAPAAPARYDVGGATYQLDVLGFANSQTSSGHSSRLVAHENKAVAGPLMARVTRTVHLAADAGPDQGVDEGSAVVLDGTGSQGEDVAYAWRQTSGPVVVLDDPSAGQPGFAAPAVSEDTAFEFELSVSAAGDPVRLTDSVVVTVRNVNRPPVLSLPDDLVVTAADASGAVVSYEVAATDPDGGEPALACTPASGSIFAPGTTTVECTASDGVDEVSGRFTVHVNTAPELQLPADLTVDATSPDGAVVTYEATATDDSGMSAVTCLPVSGTTFVIGTTTVECAAVDGHGATATGSFVVTVRGAGEQLTDLLVAVTGVGPGRSLEAKVRAAVAGLPDSSLACEPLGDFVDEVQAQSGKRIPAATAALLIADATRIHAVLACP